MNPALDVAAADLVEAFDDITPDDFAGWVDIKREEAGPDVWRDTASWLRSATAPSGGTPMLYDVGAGDGQFLQVARDEFGFAVSGNEIVAGAVDLAKHRHGIDLELGDLSTLGHVEDVDAVTMWCVLAHVSDSDALLEQVHTMLKPGGALAFQTPHRTLVDRASQTVSRASRGRVSALPDRRLAGHHRILHTQRSITAQLERIGFVDVQATPQARYSLTSHAYLVSLNPPAWTVRPASWLLDRAVQSHLAPRIILDVRARRR